MTAFQLIAEDIDVAPLLAQLEACPELWGQHQGRSREGSPHYGIPDIWVRYRAWDEITEPAKANEPHFASFYPAWYDLPAIQEIAFRLMTKVRATYLGGILITKIPAGKQVKPHTDKGGWHAHNMPLKIYVPLQSNPDCVNYCGDSSLYMKAGEAWSFDNLLLHSVVNNGAEDRITAIFCFRTT